MVEIWAMKAAPTPAGGAICHGAAVARAYGSAAPPAPAAGSEYVMQYSG